MMEPALPAALPLAHAPIFILGQTPMAETELSVVIEALASELDDENRPDKADTFRLLGQIIEQRTDFRTVRDITRESVNRNIMHRLFNMAHFTPGLAVRFARAIDPTEEDGFEWPLPPRLLSDEQERVPGAKSGPKPGTFNWSTQAKFPRTTLAPDTAVPSLRENGVFDGIVQPVPGTRLSDRSGFTVINQRIYNLAQRHPNLQGGGLQLRVQVAWMNELLSFCPPDRMPLYQSGKKKGTSRLWNLSRSFSNRRNRT